MTIDGRRKTGLIRRSLKGVLDVRIVVDRFSSLLQKPVFWLLTVWGNIFVGVGAWLLYTLEYQVNPDVRDFLDCLIWAVGIVTTVGNSHIQPQTLGGKVLTIFVMIGGAVFLWSYMALFIGALIDPELQVLEREMHDLQAGDKAKKRV